MKGIARPRFKPSFLDWMVDHQRGWRRQTFAYAAMLLMMFILMPDRLAVVTAISIFLHEVGHAMVFKYSGITPSILALFPLGMVALPRTKAGDQKAEMLPYWQFAVMILAGPLANLILLLYGALLSGASVNREFALWGEDLFIINFILLLTNFMPIWKTDGGMLFRLVVHSLHNQRKVRLGTMAIIGSISWIGLILVFASGYPLRQMLQYLQALWFVMIVIAVFVMWQWFRNRTRPIFKNKNPKMLNPWQITAVLFAYFAIILVAVTSW